MKFVVSISLLIISSCNYYSMAGSIPAHIKSVSIPLMNNETSEYGLEQKVTDNIIEKFNEQGILKVKNRDYADSIIKGTISKVDESPYTFNKEESISESEDLGLDNKEIEKLKDQLLRTLAE